MPSSPADLGGPEREIDDLMVQDPHCKIYFPKRNGYYIDADGKDLYFCSSECRDQYKASHSLE
ncbi:hypothetical protein ACFLZM_03235 [Thermodesulfobacteriota bacterium]